MTRPRFVVAMASSAGGFHALSVVLAALPGDLPAAVAVVQHLDREHRSLLPELLRRRTALAVREVVDGESLSESTVLVAPPDHHMLVNRDGTCSLTTTELVHFVRPSADLLFESVAASFGPHAIAVVLSGTGIDGALGASAVKQEGGFVIAQDQGAEFGGMPAAAVETGAVDEVLSLEQIGPALVSACGAGTGP